MNKSKRTQLISLVATAVIIIVGALSAIYFYDQKQDEVLSLQTQNEDLNVVLTERDSVVNELVDAFTEIEENLRFVKQKRNQLILENSKEGKLDKKQSIIDDINLMNDMLEKSSKRIVQLEKNLRKSGFELKSFKKKLTKLNKTIEEQNAQVVALKAELSEKDRLLADLNVKVVEMEAEITNQSKAIETKEKVIEEKVNELNKAYMAYGTYKELKEKGLLTKNGGFMWIGRHTSIREDFDQEYFTELNIQDTRSIPLHTRKATVVSEHPNNSYTLVEENGMVEYLKINNPEEFWRISKYAVISVK